MIRNIFILCMSVSFILACNDDNKNTEANTTQAINNTIKTTSIAILEQQQAVQSYKCAVAIVDHDVTQKTLSLIGSSNCGAYAIGDQGSGIPGNFSSNADWNLHLGGDESKIELGSLKSLSYSNQDTYPTVDASNPIAFGHIKLGSFKMLLIKVKYTGKIADSVKITQFDDDVVNISEGEEIFASTYNTERLEWQDAIVTRKILADPSSLVYLNKNDYDEYYLTTDGVTGYVDGGGFLYRDLDDQEVVVAIMHKPFNDEQVTLWYNLTVDVRQQLKDNGFIR